MLIFRRKCVGVDCLTWERHLSILPGPVTCTSSITKHIKHKFSRKVLKSSNYCRAHTRRQILYSLYHIVVHPEQLSLTIKIIPPVFMPDVASQYRLPLILLLIVTDPWQLRHYPSLALNAINHSVRHANVVLVPARQLCQTQCTWEATFINVTACIVGNAFVSWIGNPGNVQQSCLNSSSELRVDI